MFNKKSTMLKSIFKQQSSTFIKNAYFVSKKDQKVERASNIKFETTSSLKETNKNQNLIKFGFRVTPMVSYLLSPLFSVSRFIVIVSFST